jgi:hypothetical protein
MMLDRRRLMIGAAGLVAVATLGAGFLSVEIFGDRYRFFGEVLRRNLPGVRIKDSEVEKFVDAYWPEFSDRFGPRNSRLLKVLAWLQGALPGEKWRVVVDRHVLTNFLLGSNFFLVPDPKAAEINFFGLPRVCSNPFRRV